MKKILIFLLSLVTVCSLISCGKPDDNKPVVTDPQTGDVTEPTGGDSTVDPTTPVVYPSANSKYLEGDYDLAINPQDGVILHAWNWSYETIRLNLPKIAEAGYSTVQTSPVQQPKGYGSGLTTAVSTSWWKLYQPVSFSIGNAWLGNKDDLTRLCTEAKTYGIKIICDIVANHMANVNDFEGYDSEIGSHETQIYNNTNTYFHSYKTSSGQTRGTSDSSIELQVTGCMSGLPDLVTANSYVQERVISLLKECIDCGVSGFRFDAAKHIETPDDGDYASLFWPNVLSAASNYAKETYNRKLYYYGEILNSVGTGRSITSYTKYMSVTANGTSGSILNAVSGRKTDNYMLAVSSYSLDIPAEKAVLWVESHDTYADGSTANYSTPKLHRAWATVANRTAATALYLARTGEAGMGECGTYEWMSQEVASINRFHNQFIGADENFTIQNGYSVNERYREEDHKTGVVILNISNSSSEKDIEGIKINHLEDGIYYDHITGNRFTVEAGQISGHMGSTGIVVLYDAPLSIRPQINATQSSKYFYEGQSATLTLNVKNATSVSYSINDGQKISCEKNEVITVTEGCTVTVYAEGDSNDERTYTFYDPIEKRDGYWCIAGIGNAMLDYTPYAWVWGQGAAGKWVEVTMVGNTAYVKAGVSDYGILIAFFQKDTPIVAAKWDTEVGKTKDFGKPLDASAPYESDL